MNAKYKVTFMEYERGWGSRVDDVEFFDSYEEALKRMKDFNCKNTQETAPDWYMVATDPILVDLDKDKK